MQLAEQSSANMMLENGPPPIDITFQHLSYSVDVPDENSTICNRLPAIKKEILRDVTGIIPHGKVTAIMGASGAGKTSLLNILACRIDKSSTVHIDGDICVNGKPYDFGSFGDFANYVMQTDLMMQTLTVRETLEFAAALKLNLEKEERDATILRLVKDLKLEKCMDVMVGGPELKGISGGEKKRTSIAFELISDPQVLFLDEPTSGLDSLTAYVIVWYMKRLASRNNKTIAMTIHQPSSDIYQLFDRLIFLVAGKLVYQGNCAQAETYFAQLGFKSPEFSNPPDFFMSIMHHESKVNVDNYPRYFTGYEQQLATPVNLMIESASTGSWEHRQIGTSFCRALGTLMWRDVLNIRRNPLLVRSRIVQTAVIALIAGGLFWKLESDYTLKGLSKGFNSKNGAFFFLSVSAFMSSLSPMILTFPLEKGVFLKEQSSKMYSVGSYFLSRNLVEIPYLLIFPMITSLVVYWMIDLRSSAECFFIFYFFQLLCVLAGTSFGLFTSSFFSDPKTASGMVPLVVLPLMLFSGFYKNRRDLPEWVGWIEYISPIKYTFVGLANNEYNGTNAPISLLGFDIGMW